VTPRVRLAGGIRWDNVDDGGFASASGEANRAWSPRAGVSVQLNDEGTLSAYGQVSRAFKAPTVDQLFDPRPYPDFRGGTFTISNPRLVPQRATNVEAGVSGAGPVRWSALAYWAEVDDEIDFDVRTFSYANIGKSRHTGIELEGAGQWWRIRPFLSYAMARVTEAGSSRQLKNVPRHRVAAGAGIDLPWDVQAYARFEHAATAFLDDDNAFRIDTPSTIDLRVRRPFGRHAAFVDLFNLTADRYEDYGFTLTDFRGQVVPYVYPGAPRAVRAGVTVSF
jgi:outer membrane receptor protein involved in Fe transport